MKKQAFKVILTKYDINLFTQNIIQKYIHARMSTEFQNIVYEKHHSKTQ